MSNQEKLKPEEVVYLLLVVLAVYKDPEIPPKLADAFAMTIEDNLGIDLAAFLGLGLDSEGAGHDIEELVIPFILGYGVPDPNGARRQGLAFPGSAPELEAKRIAEALIANVARKAKGGN